MGWIGVLAGLFRLSGWDGFGRRVGALWFGVVEEVAAGVHDPLAGPLDAAGGGVLGAAQGFGGAAGESADGAAFELAAGFHEKTNGDTHLLDVIASSAPL